MSKCFVWRAVHFFVIGTVVVLLLTGFRIAALSHPEIMFFSALLPQGYLHQVHFIGGFGLLALIAAYVWYRMKSPCIEDRKEHFSILIYYGFAVIMVAALSGLLLYIDMGISLLQWHYIAAIGVLVFVLLHGVGHYITDGTSALAKVIPIGGKRRGGWQVLVVTVIGFASLYALLIPPMRSLVIHAIPADSRMEVDGIAGESQWQNAESLTIHTFGGANFDHGDTDITVKALYNGEEVFFLIRWKDETKSVRHMPLVKEGGKWKVQEEGFYVYNEVTHYEDKFALMLSTNCEAGASHTAYLGPKPLKDKPVNWHGKGYHYSTDGQIRDVWHWKAVRTNDMYQADDNFFGAPFAVKEGKRRYKGGYLADGKESGGYVMNWMWYMREGVVPKKIPKDPSRLLPYQHPDKADLSWAVPWYSYLFYDASLDRYPDGTVMPSVLYTSNQFEGDRGDIRARGVWKDGYWTLEMVRKRDTRSPYDIAIDDDVCMWVAAFDHAQTAHTRHAQPVRLSLERP